MTTAVASRVEHQKEEELYFYSNLEALMAEKGLSITELSERTGVAQSTIRSLIRGRLKRLDSLSTGKLAQFFGCKLDELYVIWFIKKAMWSSKSSIKSNATSLKKFYTFLLEKGLIEPDDLQELKETIKEEMSEWLATLERYDDPSIEDMSEVWGF